MVDPRIGVSYGVGLNGKHGPCDDEDYDLIDNIQHHRGMIRQIALIHRRRSPNESPMCPKCRVWLNLILVAG